MVRSLRCGLTPRKLCLGGSISHHWGSYHATRASAFALRHISTILSWGSGRVLALGLCRSGCSVKEYLVYLVPPAWPMEQPSWVSCHVMLWLMYYVLFASSVHCISGQLCFLGAAYGGAGGGCHYWWPHSQNVSLSCTSFWPLAPGTLCTPLGLCWLTTIPSILPSPSPLNMPTHSKLPLWVTQLPWHFSPKSSRRTWQQNSWTSNGGLPNIFG